MIILKAYIKKEKIYKDISSINSKMIPSDLSGLLDDFFSNIGDLS